MRKAYKISIVLLVIFCSALSYGQNSKIRKADKAYDRFAFIDAQEIYLKVVEDGYKSAEILKKLGNTYYFNSDYTNAARWYGDLINSFPEEAEAEYYFRAAQSMKSVGSYTVSDRYMEQFVEKGGSELIIKNYVENKDYLNNILSKPDEFIAEKAEINTANSDFGPAYYQENKLVFASAIDTIVAGRKRLHEWNNQPFLNLYVADMNEKGELSNMKKLPGDVNTRYHESSPTFTKNGDTIYFTRNNYTDGKRGRDEEKLMRLKIYRGIKSNGGFSDIQELPFNSDSYSVAHPALSPDGKRLYFSSDMAGTMGQSDLWFVDVRRDGTYGSPVNLGPSINTEARENFPFISDDNILYFSTDGRAGLGGFDIFYTELDAFGFPIDIQTFGEPVNSNKDDFGFIINEDKTIGFVSSNREGGVGSVGDDIYRIRQICKVKLTGLVTDIDTGELLPGAEVILLDKENNEISRMTVGEDALYTFELQCDAQYRVRGTKDNYIPDEKVVQTPEESAEMDVPLELKIIDPCPPNDLGCRLSLQPIYFDFDRYNIRPDAEIELAKILAAMREYKELVIYIESHTDSRGSDAYNEVLSERRAQSTLEWLVSKGISRDRLSAKGFGEYRLINECSDGVKCSEEQHQLNRRSMFIIQN